MGFEPMLLIASAFAGECSNHWAVGTEMAALSSSVINRCTVWKVNNGQRMEHGGLGDVTGE